jgi:hypothetical protein
MIPLQAVLAHASCASHPRRGRRPRREHGGELCPRRGCSGKRRPRHGHDGDYELRPRSGRDSSDSKLKRDLVRFSKKLNGKSRLLTDLLKILFSFQFFSSNFKIQIWTDFLCFR